MPDTLHRDRRDVGRFVPPESRARQAVREWALRGVAAGGAWAHQLVGQQPLGKINRGRFGILMYHRIAAEARGLPAPTINVTPDQFRRQLQGLRERGWIFWPLRRVLELTSAGQRVPPYVAVLTFDDGFDGIYRHAWPVLRRLRVPATVFLSTAYLDSPDPFPFDPWGKRLQDRVPPESYRPLTIAACREMAASGWIDFGAHTHTHQDFRGRPEAFRNDLRTNVNVLRELFGLIDVPLAFPYGTPSEGFADGQLMAAAREVGVTCALTTESMLVDPASSPFGWGRLHVFAWDTAATLAAKLHGWYDWAPRIRRRLSSRRSPRAESRGNEEMDSERGTKDAAAQHGFAAMPHDVLSVLPLRSCPPSEAALPLISIVVPTRNRAIWLREALESLALQRTGGRFAIEIVVVDNQSVDETEATVRQLTERLSVPIRYLRQPVVGDAPTRNRGVAAAAGEWLAFFDDDQLAEPDWLCELFSAAQLTGAAIVGGPVRLDLPPREWRRLGRWLRRALRETDLYAELHPYVRGQLPGTGNALVARLVFDAIGVFDETFRSGGSDYDFFTRARRAGFELWYAPRAAIRHRVDPTRLTPRHLRREALSGGAEHAAYFDYGQHGLTRLLAGAAARGGQALLVHLPLLAWASFSRNPHLRIGCWTRLWRAEGYLRRTVTILAAAAFSRGGAAPRSEGVP